MNTWQTMIKELVDRGWSLPAQAQLFGAKYSAFYDLSIGRSAEPRGSVALRLVDLHRAGFTAAEMRTVLGMQGPQKGE